MSVQALHTPPRTSTLARLNARLQENWFAWALPALMALLLILVPVIGTAAKIVFLLTLVPLLLWAIVCDIEKAIYLYFAWCWMDGTIRGLFDGNAVAIVARDLVMFAILLGWAARRLMTSHWDPWRTPPGTLLVALFVLNCLLQVANPNSLGLLACLGGFKMHFAFLPLLFIGYDVFRRREQVRAFLLFLTLATLITGAVSVVQYERGPGWTYAHFPGTNKLINQNLSFQSMTEERQVGSFKPPGTTTGGGGGGAFVGAVLPFTFALILLSGRRRFSAAVRLALGAGIFVFIVTLFLNGVRSALVSAAVGIAICAVLCGGKIAARALLIGALCGVLGLIGFAYVNSTSNGYTSDRFGSTFADPNQALHADRQTFFDQFDYLISTAPLGVGLGRVGAASAEITTDPVDQRGAIFSEAYLGNMIAETGITGALLISAITVLFLVRGYQNLRALRDPDDRVLASALLATLAVIFANFFVTPILLGLPGAPLFWLCSAILLRTFRASTVRPPTPHSVMRPEAAR